MNGLTREQLFEVFPELKEEWSYYELNIELGIYDEEYSDSLFDDALKALPLVQEATESLQNLLTTKGFSGDEDAVVQFVTEGVALGNCEANIVGMVGVELNDMYALVTVRSKQLPDQAQHVFGYLIVPTRYVQLID